MKTKEIIVTAGAIALLSGLPALAGETSVEFGKKLFNNPGLGGATSGKSCNTCHPDGAKLEKAGGNPELTKAINRCLTGSMGGKKLDGRGVEMKSLKLFSKSLAKK